MIFAYGFLGGKKLFWLFGFKELDLPYNLPVKDEEHIGDHPEHEDLDTDDDKEHREDGEGDVLYIMQPFEQHENPCKDTEK